jgi:hypothetical protein
VGLNGMAQEEEPIHVDSDQARAGETTGVMRYVLGISLFLIVAIFALLVWVW